MPITKTDFVKKYKTEKVESVDDDNDISDAQKLANWQAELSTCVYNQLKKKGLKTGRVYIINQSRDKVNPSSFFSEDRSLNEIEKFLTIDEKFEMQRVYFTYIFEFISPQTFDGSIQIHYSYNGQEFVPTIFLGMTPTTKKVTSKPSEETEFIRDKTDQVKIFDSGQYDNKKILKMGQVGDLVVDMEDAQDKLRGVASMVIDINDKGKLYLREAFDDAGYTDVPIEVTRRIENPVEFYSLVPQELEKQWGMRGLNLDPQVHAKIVKKLGKRVTVEDSGVIWYPFGGNAKLPDEEKTFSISSLEYIGKRYHGWWGYDPTLGEDEDEEEGIDTPSKHDLTVYSEAEIPQKTVIIKYQENEWFGKLKPWWNQKTSKWWKNAKQEHLPPLNTRKYIKVVEPFMEVHISADKKGSPITLDDILFATRALMVDDTRRVDGYKDIGELPSELILEPEIDNFSS